MQENSKKIPDHVVESINQMNQKNVPTPYHLYDRPGIISTAKSMREIGTCIKGFRNFFAVKALPNPHVLRLLKAEGMGADVSSMTELILADKSGFKGDDMMFTANNVPPQEWQKASQLEATINLDDATHLDKLKEALLWNFPPQTICFRFNPGRAKSGNSIIGNPAESKFGIPDSQIIDCYKRAHNFDIKNFGIHTMVASNVLDEQYFADTARLLFDKVIEIESECGIRLGFINLGGGIGIPYKPEESPVDLNLLFAGIKTEYDNHFTGQSKPDIYMECGRYVTGPHGYLVAQVRHVMEKCEGRRFVGVDASMANLMRPGMYGAYHHISVLRDGKVLSPSETTPFNVVGSLCEGNDQFAIDRPLPPDTKVGDTLIIHDTGAHGHSMGPNYNGHLRSAEYLAAENGNAYQIRRAETADDYFRTIVE